MLRVQCVTGKVRIVTFDLLVIDVIKESEVFINTILPISSPRMYLSAVCFLVINAF